MGSLTGVVRYEDALLGQLVTADFAAVRLTRPSQRTLPRTMTMATPTKIRYDTTRDAILTCAQKLTCVSLIYHTETTTKKWKTEKVKRKKNGYAQKYR